MTNSSYGVINWIAYKLGMIPTLDYSWTLQSGSAMALIVIAAVWRQLPYMMVMILAGLQSVDKSLLEAGTTARITGRVCCISPFRPSDPF